MSTRILCKVGGGGAGFEIMKCEQVLRTEQPCVWTALAKPWSVLVNRIVECALGNGPHE